MSDEMDELPELDALMRAERKHDWMSEPRFKRMFDDIEDGLQGVLGKGRYEWVDRRVFDQVFDRSTLLAVHKLMQKGEIETIDYPIARGKEAHVFHATTNHGPVAVKIFHQLMRYSRAWRSTSTAIPDSRGCHAGIENWSTSGCARSCATSSACAGTDFGYPSLLTV